MAYFLRFTGNIDERNFTSEDQVNGGQFNGVCCYDITNAVNEMIDDDYSLEDALEICSKKQAVDDNWHCSNSKGQYVIFNGEETEKDTNTVDRFYNAASIAKIENYIAIGQLKQMEYGIRCVNIKML